MVIGKRSIFTLLVYLLLVGRSYLLFSQDVADKRLKVIATTTLISSVLQEIAPDEIELVTIIPAGMCPGHFDIKPQDIKLLQGADLLVMHGFESNLFVIKILKLVKNSGLSSIALNIEGNGMIPDVYFKIIDKMVKVLSERKPENATLFTSRATEYKENISRLKREIQQEARNLKINEVKIVCSKMQAEFLKWLGFDIVATYGREEEISPKELIEVIKEAKAKKVRLVIDNLQSGPKTGISIARELKIAHFVLTNFPQEFEGKFSYIKSLETNTTNLFNLLNDAQP